MLPNLFTKSPKKKNNFDSRTIPSSTNTAASHNGTSRTSPPPPSSKTKKSPSKSSRDRDSRPSSAQGSKRHSRPSRSSRSHIFDPTEHPLNLPPHELRRLSAMSAMNDTPQPMDVENESPATNGVNGDGAPAPPPHRTPTNGPVDAEACKAAGNKFFKLKDYDKAIAEYTKAIEADPKSATYRSNRAAAYISANRWHEALEDCKVADSLEPNNAKVLQRLARVLTSLGRPADALEVYDSITPPVTPKDKAPALTMQQHLKQAEESLHEGTAGSLVVHALDQAEKGLGYNVTRPRKWLLMRGEAYIKMGNVNALGEAQTVAMSMLRANSQDPEALVLRGRALYAQGENEKALQHFRQALNCDPDFKDAVKNLRMVQKLDRMKSEGNAAFQGRRYQEAVDMYTQALQVDPSNKGINSKLLQNRAMASIKLKNFKQAIADCTRALELDSSYLKARKTRAKALGESGDWEEAVKELKEIAENNPSEPGIQKEIRNAELELKKSKRKDYYKILGVDKDADDAQIKKAYKKLAIVHHPDKNGNDEAAADRFKEIVEAYETLADPEYVFPPFGYLLSPYRILEPAN
ncbi:TPR-like protein [Xylona heveae TC161]|uniref:TPR-like protein n=1 Tax=Xylona heveae (strain CBS 132557 / TC161) TaxID=1328760 RepID=A0A165HZN0_XYLHT|nr:TPR-like protein [Xylona heveae TC161]KZF24144.1 TPR-like protein [Xylona heveae TC161]